MNQYKEDKTAEYESLIAELRKQLANEEYGSGLREKVIEKMQAEIQEAGNLCKSMNSELVNLRKQEIDNSYIIENQKHYLEEMAKSNKELEEENKVLKFFARRFLAVE
jgi:hemerythrin-like domain-containing protein